MTNRTWPDLAGDQGAGAGSGFNFIVQIIPDYGRAGRPFLYIKRGFLLRS
jgi:hypothetical protein